MSAQIFHFDFRTIFAICTAGTWGKPQKEGGNDKGEISGEK